MEKYDFSGWATKNDLLCSDGRTIKHNAFKDDDGHKVPLVWNHQHNESENILGHAMLENRDEGVYAYCSFNDTESAQNAKKLVQHGDICSLSIYANKLKQNGGDVIHGAIREVSLVIAGANPGAFIDSVIVHGEESEDEAIIYNDCDINPEEGEIEHSDNSNKKDEEDNKVSDEKKLDKKDQDQRTLKDVFETLNDEQKTMVYALVGTVANEKEKDNDEDSKGGSEMKKNVFEHSEENEVNVLSHADQSAILDMAKATNCGSLQAAISNYVESNDTLAHGIDNLETLFPEYKNMMPGAPEAIPQNNTWVDKVINKAHKSPFSRIRTRQADISAIRSLGYKTKGSKKKDMGNVSLVTRTTDPQTIYIKDKLNRDDIMDIQDFDVVNYEYGIMRGNLNEEIATAVLVGDGRDPGAEDKIETTHIRPIWQDDEMYTIHADVNVTSAKATLQGTDTGANFGDNYVFAEAVIEAALYAREQYKGTGKPDFYCTTHTVNRMLLARDLNGRRIYNSKADLAAALNVGSIEEVDKMDNLTRTTDDEMPKTKKLLGLFVNMDDYNLGSVKGGEITKFNQFDIDFNQEKFLMETRLSGALTRVKSAIALEEDVTV